MIENKLKQARQAHHPEDIENQLKLAMRKNDQYLYIVETDDLITAWCYERKNKFIRSIDPSRVPTQYRYSAPPSDSSRMIACHVGLQHQAVSSPLRLRDGGPNQLCQLPHVSLSAGDALVSVDQAHGQIRCPADHLPDSALECSGGDFIG